MPGTWIIFTERRGGPEPSELARSQHFQANEAIITHNRTRFSGVWDWDVGSAGVVTTAAQYRRVWMGGGGAYLLLGIGAHPQVARGALGCAQNSRTQLLRIPCMLTPGRPGHADVSLY